MEKVTPRILQGFMELLPEDQIMFEQMKETIKRVYQKYGYLPLDTPVLEYSNILLAKAGGETEKQIYRFNKGDNDISLRFDLTVPLARYTSQNYNNLIFPYKRYQIGKVFRGERPQKGRFREFYQCDIDVINENLSLIYDAEIPAVIYDLFKELNFGKFTIRINNRKVLNGFFEELNLTKEEITEVLRIIDKLEKIGIEKVQEELNKIIDKKEIIEKILAFINIKGTNKEIIQKLEELNIKNELFTKGTNELKETINNIISFGVEEEYFTIDLTIARGLDYYTGTIYETVLNDYPRLGSVCSGGRYDNLTEYYSDKKLEGVGMSIGLTRLFYQLKEANIISPKAKTLSKVLLIPFENKNMSYAINISKELRKNNIICDIFVEEKNIKQKMKYSNRVEVPYVCILGETEEQNQKVTLKNMETGEQKELNINEMIELLK